MGFVSLDLGINEGEKKDLEFEGVPFTICTKNKRSLHMSYLKPVRVGAEIEGFCCLGMTTQAESGECGWIGEKYNAWQRKLFIGDMLGRIDILYVGNVMDAIPLIFGVNVWNYDLFFNRKEYEGEVYPIRTPYREPFDSDINAAKLLKEALKLYECDGDKYTKFIFTFRTRKRAVESITLKISPGRLVGVGISAITTFSDPNILLDEKWNSTDICYYVKKKYFSSMDRLARRLYQFCDDIPEFFQQDIPDGYSGPVISFKGTREAELLANVYYHNIYDMANSKVEKDGTLHTSSRNAPCYGFYSGIGTYRDKGQYNYYKEIWSRDIGRLLCELAEHGESVKCKSAAEVLLKYLYDPGIIYKKPNWKRIVNASELGVWPESYGSITFSQFARGKENDGHASVLIMLYRLYRHGIVDRCWVKENFTALMDAAEWYCWQMDNPEESGFEDVLCSESEASYGDYGGYDLYSNTYAYHALVAVSRLAEAVGEEKSCKRWDKYASRLHSGIKKLFYGCNERHGTVLCEPESDNWPLDLKRLAGLLLFPELFSYEPSDSDPEMLKIWRNTYEAQKEMYFSPMAGGSMGYGQGFLTQIAMLLDEVEDYSACLDWVARFSYYHTGYKYIVPEGVTYHPSGRFWYRHTDLGNAVQQAEIMKCIRLVLGLDDLDPEQGLKLVPRMPDRWQSLEADGYKVAAYVDCNLSMLPVHFYYKRMENGYKLGFECSVPVKMAYIRVGPFAYDMTNVRVEGVDTGIQIQKLAGRCYVSIKLDREIKDLEVEIYDLRTVAKES
jgi:hypothetical protein